MKFGHELQPFSFVRSTRSLTLSSYICDFGADIRPVARGIEGNLVFFRDRFLITFQEWAEEVVGTSTPN